MPSVGMKKARVFGLRTVDGSRNLRSGRRVFADFIRWYPLNDDEADRGLTGQVRLHSLSEGLRDVKRKRVAVVGICEDDDCVAKLPEPVKLLAKINHDGESCGVDRMFGKVYSRKRKMDVSDKSDVSDEIDGSDVVLGDGLFGLRFIRRKRSKKIDVEHCQRSIELRFNKPRSLPLRPQSRDPVLTMFSGSNIAHGCFSNVILSVLRYVKNPDLGVAKVYEFLQSNPIHEVFASKGMSFLQSYPPTRSSGTCVIFGAIESISMFRLDFSAVPLSFMYLHSKIFLRSIWIPTRLVCNRQLYEVGSIDEEQRVYGPGRISLESKGVPFGLECSEIRTLSHPSVRASRLGIQTMQYRNSFSSSGVRKKKRSLRGTIRPRSYSFGLFTADDMENYVSLRSTASFNRHKNLASRESARHINEAHSDDGRSAMDVDSSSCKANILILESDKFLREEGVDIVLEFSASFDWLLVVKKDGSTRHTFKAENITKLSSCNRFTHPMLWSLDNGWKLEFRNRRDWIVFKDLYKKCYNRNIPCSTAEAIPVPCVSEVQGYVDSSSAFFQRPDAYISIKDDEVCRAMAKTTANYDMDSDDEEWLSKFNNELIATDKYQECISMDTFELMIDAFEKESFYGLDAFSNEKLPDDICMHLGSRPVIKSLFAFWTKKRRQRKSSLINVFQAHQAKKKPQVVPKPINRRRRSLIRQSSESLTILEESMQDDLASQKIAMLKYEEAKAEAEKRTKTAIEKRQRAQLLLKKADAATGKARMAFRIVDALRASELLKAEAAATAASCFMEEIHYS